MFQSWGYNLNKQAASLAILIYSMSYGARLAKIFPKEKNREIILKTRVVNPEHHMVSPYMYHHYIDALIRAGEPELAMEEMRFYWGGMIENGADTFWELYNPDNKDESP